MLQSVSCPYCNQEIELKSAPMSASFEGKDYNITQYFYYCDICEEGFSTEETDTETLSQIPGFIEQAQSNWDEHIKQKGAHKGTSQGGSSNSI